ncbi:NTF2 domain-containing protein [Aphelenchoides bicaudatus]|nr:NTF2 domain-containing protein [Aphelenchoides bicaudatus]
MSDTRTAVKDQELCSKVKKFYYIYYEAMDSRRDKISFLYTSNETPSLTWNGHHVDGIEAIRAFIEQLPKTEHSITCVNPQSIDVPGSEGWAIVTAMGTVTIGGQVHGFTHNFVLVPENNAFHILDEQYRFID